jgi:hypothetical protein
MYLVLNSAEHAFAVEDPAQTNKNTPLAQGATACTD